METYINPPAFIEEQKAKIAAKRKKKRLLPEEPRRDVLQFLLEHAPLENWERDILAMVRDEAYYFAPQAMTKISNEGWAAYWHSVIMTQRALTDSEVIDFADHHSGTLAMSPGRLNPYKIGIELFRDVEDRWNKGKFGRDYDDCDDLEARKRWDRKLGLGRQKIFEVRTIYNDVTFVDAFLTEEFCRPAGDRQQGLAQGEGAPALLPHQPRPADRARDRRQLRQPRRAVPPASLRERAARRREGAGHPEEPPPHLAPARARRDDGRRARAPAVLRRRRAQDDEALASKGGLRRPPLNPARSGEVNSPPRAAVSISSSPRAHGRGGRGIRRPRPPGPARSGR